MYILYLNVTFSYAVMQLIYDNKIYKNNVMHFYNI